MKKRIALILNDRFEELEAVAIIDILRRANLDVDIVGIDDHQEIYSGSHQIKIHSDIGWTNFLAKEYDGIVIPGGPGVETLLEHTQLIDVIKKYHLDNKLVAAICAAPQILGKAQILTNKKVVHYPTTSKYLYNANKQINQPFIIDGNIITGTSAGTAILFALAIVEYFFGLKFANDLKATLVTINY